MSIINVGEIILMQKLEKTIKKINFYNQLETILAIVFLFFSITTLYNLILDNEILPMIGLAISFVALLCTNPDKKIKKLKCNFAELQLVDWDYRYLIPSGTTFLRGPQNQYARIILITIMPDCNVKTISIEEEVFNKIFVEK